MALFWRGTGRKKPKQLCTHQRQDLQEQPTLVIEPKTSQLIDDSGNVPMESATERDEIKPKTGELRSTDAAGLTAPCAVCKDEKRAARRYRWKLIAGLFFPATVQALDTTIIASALPFIGSEFRASPSAIS
jgi:hypothetical protein